MLAMDCLRKCDGKVEPFILLSHVSHKLHSVTDSPFSCFKMQYLVTGMRY